MKAFAQKIKSNLISLLPVMIVVLILGLTISPLSWFDFGMFFIACLLLIVGIAFFTVGADYSMYTIGSSIGGHLSKSRKIFAMTALSVLIGFIITLAEPDLSVLASQVTSVNMWLFIAIVSLGVGLMLGIAVLKILFQIKTKTLLFITYSIVIILALFSPLNFLPVGLDSGAVTTGSISVPFILAFGLGLSAVRGGHRDENESFGLIALVSVGPLITALILSLFVSGGATSTSNLITTSQSGTFLDMLSNFGTMLLNNLWQIALVMLPIIILFLIFNKLYFKYPTKKIIKIFIGLGYTYIGIILFLTAVMTGFLPIASILGYGIYSSEFNYLLLPIAGIIGYLIVMSEPAVLVLSKKVEDVTQGTISKKLMRICISIGVCLALILSVLRILFQINFLYLILPIYFITLLVTIFSPAMFTALAFDSGGVAAGTMATSFIMPFLMGICSAKGLDVVYGGFGTVALIAIMPILVINVLGVIYRVITYHKQSKEKQKRKKPVEIIEFIWEE